MALPLMRETQIMIFRPEALSSASRKWSLCSSSPSQEMTPVATDTINYAVGETKESVRELAGAVGEGLGLRNGAGGAVHVRCPKCNHENEADAQFCSQCGSPMVRTVACASCGHVNQPDARFCDRCGGQIRG